jgi:ferric-dicitrate binding protein FerR (iron transport regulator)
VNHELSRLSERKTTKGRTIKLNWYQTALRIAATVTIIAGLYYIFRPDTVVSYSTVAGNRLTHELPDGSVATLNSLSSISYDPDSWENNRSVELTGEVYFKVAKGSTFSVISEQGEVRVLGTQFNVTDRSGFYEVICYEGLVQVDHLNNSEKLSRNQSLRSIAGQLEIDEYPVGVRPSWLDNKSTFRKVPAGKVFEELERQYGVNIVTNSGVDLDENFTGSFPHDNLNLALESVTTPLSLTFNENNGTIEITSAD